MKTARSSGGFSLIEVLCAILVLGVGLVGLVQGVATALRSTQESAALTSTALVAAGRIELLRAEGFLEASEREGDCDEWIGPYRWREIVAETSTEGLYDVEVVIENRNSGREIYSLRTLLFDPPLLSSTEEDSRDSESGARRRRDVERR